MTRQLEIIGEAVKRLGDGVTQAEPAVPWRLIAGIRDRLFHGYFQVDPDAVLAIVARDLLVLELQIRRLPASQFLIE